MSAAEFAVWAAGGGPSHDSPPTAQRWWEVNTLPVRVLLRTITELYEAHGEMWSDSEAVPGFDQFADNSALLLTLAGQILSYGDVLARAGTRWGEEEEERDRKRDAAFVSLLEEISPHVPASEVFSALLAEARGYSARSALAWYTAPQRTPAGPLFPAANPDAEGAR